MNESFKALLIGVPWYLDTAIDDLPFIENDLAELTQALRGVNYAVTVHPTEQTDQAAIDTAIELFLAEAEQDSTLLLFLSGHGIHYAGSDYLVPAGANTSVANFPRRCVPIEFDDYIESSQAGNVIVMIDACREGIRLREKGMNVVSWSDREIKRIESRKLAYVYACSKGENALYSAGDRVSQFSFFSRALTQVLTENRGQLTLSMLEREVQRVLRQLTTDHQRPRQQVKILTDMSETEREVFAVARKWASPHARTEASRWNVTLRQKVTLGAGVRSLRYSPNGKLLVSGGHRAEVNLFHIDDSGLTARRRTIEYGRIPIAQSVLAVCFSSDSRVLVAGGNDRRLKLYEIGVTRARDATILRPHDDIISGLAVSSDGQVMLSSSHDMTSIVWRTDDPAQPTRMAVLRGHQDHINTVRFSPNTRVGATGSTDTSVILWDLGDLEAPVQLATLKGHPSAVRAVAFSPDGKMIATGDVDGKLIIWDLGDLSLPARKATVTCSAGVLALDFHPYAGLLAAGQSDGSVILWDLTDPSAPFKSKTLNGHSRRVRALNFAPDGKTLATGSRDSTVLLWGIQRQGS